MSLFISPNTVHLTDVNIIIYKYLIDGHPPATICFNNYFLMRHFPKRLCKGKQPDKAEETKTPGKLRMVPFFCFIFSSVKGILLVKIVRNS